MLSFQLISPVASNCQSMTILTARISTLDNIHSVGDNRQEFPQSPDWRCTQWGMYVPKIAIYWLNVASELKKPLDIKSFFMFFL